MKFLSTGKAFSSKQFNYLSANDQAAVGKLKQYEYVDAGTIAGAKKTLGAASSSAQYMIILNFAMQLAK